MGILSNIFTNRAVKNAVQQYRNHSDYTDTVFTRNLDYHQFFDGLNRGGKYDNYYGDFNRIISVAPSYPIYYVDKNNNKVESGNFVKYLETPNEDYPQFKVLQQIYTEMLTHGYSDIFLWRKDGRNETNHFEPGKKYKEEDFRGITLVSGYDRAQLSAKDRKNIVRINYGASQNNVFLGYSPTQASNAWRKMQDEMGLHMTAFARNAGMPLGKFIITAPSPEEYKKVKDKLEPEITGARNTGKILFDYRPSESKITQIEWVQFTSDRVQDYTKQLEFSEKKMTQNFGVPGTIKGTNDGENYATARVSQLVFIEYTIKPLVEDFKSQLSHRLAQRFELSGELKVNIPLPEIADESLVKIQATKQQVELFDAKLAEGYTPESIVAAYDLPESFLLLERAESTEESSSNTPKNALKQQIHENMAKNALTEYEREQIEAKYREVAKEYADRILRDGVSDEIREDFENKMGVVFSSEYVRLYDKALDDVAKALTEILDVVDIADLHLTDEELEEAVKQYNRRVSDFSKTFAADVAKLPGETLEVRSRAARPNIERVAVTETEHTRIVSELKSWTKAQEEFPVRVTKRWSALPDACSECKALDDIEIDVTALFVDNPNIKEIYEVGGGGLHPNCRCIVFYEMEAEAVREF